MLRNNDKHDCTIDQKGAFGEKNAPSAGRAGHFSRAKMMRAKQKTNTLFKLVLRCAWCATEQHLCWKTKIELSVLPLMVLGCLIRMARIRLPSIVSSFYSLVKWSLSMVPS